MQKTDESYGVSVGYCKLNHAVIPIVTVVPDMVSLLQQIFAPPDTWYADTGLAMPFPWLLCIKTIRTIYFLVKRGAIYSYSFILKMY